MDFFKYEFNYKVIAGIPINHSTLSALDLKAMEDDIIDMFSAKYDLYVTIESSVTYRPE